MRQQILIAAALMHDPEIVILDEPSSGLDVGATLVLKELVRTLAADGKVVLYSSRGPEIVEQVCSSVVILREVRVVARDRVEWLRTLMRQPSLERVFTELARLEDAEAVTGELMEAIKL